MYIIENITSCLMPTLHHVNQCTLLRFLTIYQKGRLIPKQSQNTKLSSLLMKTKISQKYELTS